MQETISTTQFQNRAMENTSVTRTTDASVTMHDG
uniref:Uncharacterized protein n=1 Tax=Setaria italica TaxID=4555 RepID=K4APJ2_SETIT